MSAPEILEGVLVDADGGESEKPLWVDVELYRGKKLLHHEKRLAPAALRLDDGTLVRAEISSDRLRPARELSDSFGDLFEDPLAQQVLDHAPGDHVKVRLVGEVLMSGERVALHGLVSFDKQGDGYREASEAPSRIEVRAAATGEGARARVEAEAERQKTTPQNKAAAQKKGTSKTAEPEPQAAEARPLSLLPCLLWLTVAAASIAVGASGLVLPRVAYVSFGVAFVAATILVFRRRRWVPELGPFSGGRGSTQYRWHARRWLGIFIGLGALFLWVVTISPEQSENEIDQFFVSTGPYFFIVIPLLAFAALVASDQKSANRVQRLLSAKRLDKDAKSGSFGAIEGRLEGSVDRATKYRRSASSRKETRTNSRGEHVTTTRTSYRVSSSTSGSSGTVYVTTDGGPVEVALEDALFAVDAPEVKQESGLRALVGVATGQFATMTERAAKGDSVLVVGRVQEKNGTRTFKAGGPESLFLYAAKGSARSSLVAHLALHYASLLALLGCAAAIGWIASAF